MIQTPFRERGADYYDRVYANGEYTAACQPVYGAVLDYLARMPDPRVLEVGCGTGDLALQIVERKIPYRGFDLSPVAIDRGRARGLAQVQVGNAYDAVSYEPDDYNLVLALEVFEHIDDLRALRNFPPHKQVLFSVPDYVETSHLRAYQDPKRDIVEYYDGLLSIGTVLPFKFRSKAGITLTIFLTHAVTGNGPCTKPRAA